MTTKDIASVAGVSVDTIVRTAKEHFPYRFSQGKRVVFTKDEAIIIMGKLRKKGFIELPQNEEVLPQNTEVVTKSDLAAFGASIVTEIMKQFLPLIQNNQKQIEFIQDYFSIKGYSNKMNQQLTFSEAVSLGRIAGKISRERQIEIRRVEDEKFGHVNSYRIDILKEVFEA